MSEVDLSDDYANAKYIADAKSFPGKWQAKATNFRNNKTLLSNVELDIRYGTSEREKMDIFYPKISFLLFETIIPPPPVVIILFPLK